MRLLEELKAKQYDDLWKQMNMSGAQDRMLQRLTQTVQDTESSLARLLRAVIRYLESDECHDRGRLRVDDRRSSHHYRPPSPPLEVTFRETSITTAEKLHEVFQLLIQRDREARTITEKYAVLRDERDFILSYLPDTRGRRSSGAKDVDVPLQQLFTAYIAKNDDVASDLQTTVEMLKNDLASAAARYHSAETQLVDVQKAVDEMKTTLQSKEAQITKITKKVATQRDSLCRNGSKQNDRRGGQNRSGRHPSFDGSIGRESSEDGIEHSFRSADDGPTETARIKDIDKDSTYGESIWQSSQRQANVGQKHVGEEDNLAGRNKGKGKVTETEADADDIVHISNGIMHASNERMRQKKFVEIPGAAANTTTASEFFSDTELETATRRPAHGRRDAESDPDEVGNGYVPSMGKANGRRHRLVQGEDHVAARVQPPLTQLHKSTRVKLTVGRPTKVGGQNGINDIFGDLGVLRGMAFTKVSGRLM